MSAPPLIHMALAPSSSSSSAPSRTAAHLCAPALHRSPAFQTCRPGRCFLSLKVVVAQVKEAKGMQLKTGQVVPSLRAASLVTSSVLPEIIAGHSHTFQNVSSEEELLAGIKREVEEKRIPYQAGCGMEELYYNYRNAVLRNEVFYNQEKVVQIMATVLDRILLQFEEPFTFSPYHKAIREPYGYFAFGQNYIRPLIDFRNSYLGNAHLFDRITNQLKQGHNVVLFSNHQTEADPAVMTLLLESTHASLAESLIFIAGDRVVLDPFCKPFSMGRNLLCVHSKKHINDIPELADMKRKSNIRSLKELGLLLRKGGQLIWIAPSGGRDRPDPITGQLLPATFDISSVDNMRRLTEQARVPAHLYPLALLCYDIMPPPLEVLKEIGEKRYLGFSGVGMSISEETNFPECAATSYNPEEARKVFSQAIWDQVKENYTVLMNAVYGGKGLAASTSFVALSQSWIKCSTVHNSTPFYRGQ